MDQHPPGQPLDKAPAARLGFAAGDPAHAVPINLDTVLRLAESQNGQTAVARDKLYEAFANHDLARKAWLPDLWVGVAWYRHEGGIANEDGTLTRSSFGSLFSGVELCSRFDLRDAVYKKVDAERHIWQQRAEVSKLSTEALMDASAAYIDLLAARAAEATAVQIVENLADLLKQTETLAKTLPAANLEVSRIQGELNGQRILARKFREGALAATAKLIYLLGLDPSSEFVLMDRHLAAFALVRADASTEELVALAQQQGPGVREMEGLLHLIQDATAKSSGMAQFLPVVDFRVAEGGFGTGPGDRMDWDNRLDLGIQVRWNLMEWATKRERQRILQAKTSQAHATFQDLRAKLTMGVQEARETIFSASDQMDLSKVQVEHTTKAYETSRSRLTTLPVKDRNPNEVLLSIRALNAANLAYLSAIRDHDKAQLRLAILTGVIGGQCR
jgi:outer membrane protein TolC